MPEGPAPPAEHPPRSGEQDSRRTLNSDHQKLGSSTVAGTSSRPLTARSVLASTLLGTDPPRLPVSFLVRTGVLFGLAEGTVRTALSRMVAAGDLRTDGDGWYELTEALAARRERQERSRAARLREWSGRWWIGVVAPGGRSPQARAALRRQMEQLRLAELREGVWVRPDNLAADQRPDRSTPAGTLGAVHWFLGDPVLDLDHAEADLATALWDLDGWTVRARELRRQMHELLDRLERDDQDALAPGFVLSAAVLRHFLADPLLPRELLPRHWPGDALRADYDRYDRAYRRSLSEWSGRPEAPGA
jgi:phenylacetic acid degradation operon negative regulatory protein